MKQRIVFNGVEYAGPEQMPEDVRDEYWRALSLLADEDGNGRPDVIDRLARNGRDHGTMDGFKDSSRLQPDESDLIEPARTAGGPHISVDRTFTVTYLNVDGSTSIRTQPDVRRFIGRALFYVILGLLALLIIRAWPG
jgi:hypothetical protein